MIHKKRLLGKIKNQGPASNLIFTFAIPKRFHQ